MRELTARHVACFLVIFGLIGLGIREADLTAYNLQQMQAEAFGARGEFILGGSNHPLLQPQGDAFLLDESVYPAKQPGNAVLGAIWYRALHAAGLSYDSDYVRLSAWVTWLTTGLLVSVVAVIWSVLAGSILGPAIWIFATPVWAYVGVLHHDISGSALLALGLVIWIYRPRWAVLSGFLFGLTTFFSMLTAPMAIMAMMVLLLPRRSHSGLSPSGLSPSGFATSLAGSKLFIVGTAALGLLPALVYNWAHFGSPLLFPNWVGQYTDTYFAPSLQTISGHLWRYLGIGNLSLWLYAPVTGAGLFLLFASDRPSWARWLWLLPLGHLGYVFSMETFGHCQFGPRYLLPLHALAAVLIADLNSRRRLSGVWLITLSYSSLIAATGLMTGTMVCEIDRFIPTIYWLGLKPESFAPSNHPLWFWSLASLTIGAALLFVCRRAALQKAKR